MGRFFGHQERERGSSLSQRALNAGLASSQLVRGAAGSRLTPTSLVIDVSAEAARSGVCGGSQDNDIKYSRPADGICAVFPVFSLTDAFPVLPA